MWLDIGLVVSGLALSSFWEQVGDIMGFTFIMAGLLDVLET